MARPVRSPRGNPRSSPTPNAGDGLRYIVLAVVAGILIAAGVWWWLRSRTTPAGAVVLISIDTLRADHLPVYGYTKGRTPAIDALAAESVVFDHAYAHAPQTLPSHTSILTGLLPF